MKRRSFLSAVGAFAGASGLAVGSGAFNFANVERSVSVSVADDNAAFLALTQLGDGKRSIEDDTPEQVEFSFPGLDERLDDPDFGLGTDSVYEFDRDADESQKSNPAEGLLRIENRGTQTVEVYSEHETDSELEIELFDVTDSGKTPLRDDPAELDVGESVDVGFRIRTFGADVDTFHESVTIVAEATH